MYNNKSSLPPRLLISTCSIVKESDHEMSPISENSSLLTSSLTSLPFTRQHTAGSFMYKHKHEAIHRDEEIKIESNDKKEDYFFSLYQNARKSIESSSPTKLKSPPSNTDLSIINTLSPQSPKEIVSPSYPLSSPSYSSPIDSTYLKSLLHGSFNFPPQVNGFRENTKPPLRPYSPSIREHGKCLTGNCKWLFPLDRCHSCRPDDNRIPDNVIMHQRAFFNSEFLLRQKEKWRRPRTVYTEKQLASLEKSYKKNKYLRGQERKELCKTLTLEERHIKVWYQNRRAKERGQIRHDKWLQKINRQQVNKKNSNVTNSNGN